jgi:hypothetical protein
MVDEVKKQTSTKNPLGLVRNTWAMDTDKENDLTTLEQKFAKRRNISEWIMVVLIVLAFVLFFIKGSIPHELNVFYNILVMLLMAVIYFVGIVRKNISYVILKRSLSRAKIRVIIIYCFIRLLLDIGTGQEIIAIYYIIGTVVVLSLDAIEFKSKSFAVVMGLSVLLMNIVGYAVNSAILRKIIDHKTIHSVFGNRTKGLIPETFWYTGNQKNFITKTDVKAYIYWNIFTLVAGGIMHMIIVDKRIDQKLIFVYGRILRPNLYARDPRNSRTSCLDKKRSYGEVGFAVSLFGCFLCYIFAYFNEKNLLNDNPLFLAVYICFALLGIISYGCILWRNFNFYVLKRLLMQSSFIIVMLMCMYRLFIAFTQENKPEGSKLAAIVYTIFSMIVVMLDVIEEKSRPFAILCVLVSVVANLSNIVTHTFFNSGLTKYGEYKHTSFGVRIRTERRKIYLTILTHTLGGLVTILRDSSNIKLAFIKNRVYRRTGSTSAYIGRNKFLQMREREVSVEKGRPNLTS